MVRLGIGLYGIDPTGKFEGLLEPVFALKTTISQIKRIGPNESIGYSRKSISDKARIIAVLALGYADATDVVNTLHTPRVPAAEFTHWLA